MTAAGLFRLLGDDARLRILRLLDAEQLNVSELTAILGIAQSGVSRHLGLLKEAGLVEERRDAGFTYFRLAPGLQPGRQSAERDGGSGANGFGPVWPLLQSHFQAAASSPQGRADAARLEEIRRVRKENFDEHGAADEQRQIVPGRSWAAWARALGHLLPELDVADLGCGDGYLAVELSRFARKVIAIDHSDAALERARALSERLARRSPGEGGRRVRNVEWRRGEIEKLPLDDESVDVALLSQALHHATDPEAALAEAARILRPGGRVLVLDLRRHDEAWVRERLGDKWLGFEDDELRAMLEKAGLSGVRVTVGTRRPRDPFTVLIASGVKNAR